MRSPKEIAEQLDSLRFSILLESELDKSKVRQLLQEAIETLQNIPDLEKVENNTVEEYKVEFKLTCKADLTDGFELAIEQLGYQIIDSSWDDDNDIMYYTVIKNK